MPNYPYYYPTYQPQMPMQQAQPQMQSANDSGVIWVQGEAGAKAYPVAAGKSVQLMDTEESVFYIKTVDQSGMPQPLRIFEYTERSAQNRSVAPAAANVDVVTREEFEALRSDVKRLSKGIKRSDMKEDKDDE